MRSLINGLEILEAKKHGKQNQIEGKFTTGDRVVVIEDLISTCRKT